MRRLIFLTALVLAAAPAAAFAGSPPGAEQNAAKACSALRTSMGVESFRSFYGLNAGKANAFGKCVSKLMAEAEENREAASADCRAEKADAGFAAAHGGQSFAQVYGSLGKCVSAESEEASEAEAAATVKAAKACKSSRTADSVAFSSRYGSGKNALGKCISAKTD